MIVGDWSRDLKNPRRVFTGFGKPKPKVKRTLGDLVRMSRRPKVAITLAKVILND